MTRVQRLALILAFTSCLGVMPGCLGAGQLNDQETPTPPVERFVPIELADHPLFPNDRVLDVSISMDPDDWEALRLQSRSFVGEFAGDCRSAPFTSSYTYFPGDLVVDGQVLSNIGLRKKGFIGSQSITKPSLRLNLDEYVEGAELGGVDNITLNNAVQDPALLRQCLVYELFRQAGLPASRCGFARVEVNGEDLGVYAHVEPVKRSFLRERFGNDDGDLYEGTLSDVDSGWVDTFDAKTGDTDPNLQPLRELTDDLAEGESLEGVLDAHIDLDRFLTFWAMETWVGHWDGYAGNQNNFFMYRDPAQGRLVFLPWGTDGTLRASGEGRSGHFSTGLIANKILSAPSLRDRYLSRVEAVGAEVWREEDILGEIARMETLIEAQLGALTPFGAINEVRDFVEDQRTQISDASAESGPFRAPFCLNEFGTLNATFETTWGSSQGGFDGIWDAGTLDLEIAWDGELVPFVATGVMAGPTEPGSTATSVVMAGEYGPPDGPEYLIPFTEFRNEDGLSGAPLPIGQAGGANAGLMYSGPGSNYEAVQAAMLYGGSLSFELFEPTPGAAVRGTWSTGLFGWSEVQ